jgi:nucleoside-diphosphate-sugar epimerase
MMNEIKETVLVTGGTGFLGSHIINCLLKKRYNVILLKRSNSNTWRINGLIDNIKVYDIDADGIDRAFKDQHIDIIIHTACTYGKKNESMFLVAETNIMFGIRILEYALNYKVDTFFNTDSFFNTNSDLPKYLNTYSLSKRQFTEWLKQNS